jgi:glucokinase
VAALKWLPYGGLYLTGGLTPKNIALIQDPEGPFMAALLDKVLQIPHSNNLN